MESMYRGRTCCSQDGSLPRYSEADQGFPRQLPQRGKIVQLDQSRRPTASCLPKDRQEDSGANEPNTEAGREDNRKR